MKRQKSKAREIHSIERKRLKASLQRMEQTLTTERAQLQRVTAKRDAHEAALEALKQRVQRMQRKTAQVQEDAERQAKAAAEASFQKQLLAHEEHCEEVTRDLEEMEQIARFHEDNARQLQEHVRTCEAGKCENAQRTREALQQMQAENTTLFEQIAVYENVLQEQEEELVEANRRNQLDGAMASSPRTPPVHATSPRRRQKQQQSPSAHRYEKPLHEMQPRGPRSPVTKLRQRSGERDGAKAFASLGEEARTERFTSM